MKLNPLQFIIILLSVVLFSCNSSNQLEVNKENFDQPIAQQQNLVFAFNKDVFPDSMLYKWDSTEYVTFSPAVEGVFRWSSSSELIFSPAKGFLPETEYKATLNKSILRLSKYNYSLKDKELSFHTIPLTMTAGNVSWIRGQSMANVMVQLDVDFNYDVDVADAAAHIKLASEKKDVATTVLNKGVGRRVSLQFAPLTELDETKPLNIKIEKGISIAEGKVKSGLDTLVETFVPSRFNLAIINLTSQHTGLQGIVTINTSQPIDEVELKKKIKLTPSVPYEIETTESSIILTSDKFAVTDKYEVDISKDIEGLFGGKMKEDFVGEISFKELEPSISFTSTNGMFLSTKGNRNITLDIVSIPKVKVTIYKIYENNIEHFLRRGTSYGYDYDEEDDYHSYNYYNTERYGDEVFSKEYETAKLPKNNAVSILNLDFRDKIKSYDGTYIVKVESTDKSWLQDSKVLNFSDIGLIVKQGADDVYVFANSIRNATPLEGVKVTFISTNNQVLDVQTTDNEGMVRLADIKEKHPGFNIGLVTAKKEGEFSFISFSRHSIETSRYDVGGRYPNSTGLNAMIYAERNLYRPGETVHVSTIIRNESWNNPGEMPVKLQLMMPSGKEFAIYKKILNKEGACETSFDIPNTALTGTYTLNVLTGNNVLVNSYPISIEDFIPDRIKADLSLNKEEYNPGDSIKAVLQVDNLFGTPAIGRNFDAELNVSKKEFRVKALPDYSFDVVNNKNYHFEYTNGNTDEKGAANFSFPIKKEYKGSGLLEGNVMATAFDETGRPVHRYSHFAIYTQPVFVGIGEYDHYVSTRSAQSIKLIAVNKDGKIQNNVTADVTLIKKDWHTVIQQSGSSYRYVSQKEEKVLRQSKVKISGQGTKYTFNPELSGEYEVRVAPEGYDGYVSATIYAWGYNDTRYSSFEVNNEGNVTIKTDKDKYSVGEDVKLLFSTPFEGRMLLTIERDKVLEHVFLNTENKSASYTLKASGDHVPNVYVATTLFRPMDNSALPLTVAHGYKSISIEDKSTKLSVAITSVEKSRSKSKQKIKIKTAPGAYVTIAAVDEGILQVKNYKTPDPYNYFYQKVALSTHSYDVYPYLLPEVKTRLSSTGGDGGDESAMRANPLFVNRVKNVSFWSGIKQADGSGNVSYEIDIPQFSGDIRVMALAYKSNAFGSSEEHMKVADPIVISTALPRFFSPGDEAKVAVTVSNTTAKDANANITMSVKGPLAIKGQAKQAVKIKANSEQRVVFDVGAQMSIGAGEVAIAVNALNETFTNETEISIRPTVGLQKKYLSGEVRGGSDKVLDLKNNFLPGTVKGKIVITKSPLTAFSKDITELVKYPYGCVEQTTSAVFPQLYYHDLVKSIYKTESKNVNPGYNIQQAILKLQSMQMHNGALSYWPGGGYESWWGSVYACHFLLEAKKAGYAVNNRTIERLQEYMIEMLKARKTYVLYYNENLSKEIAAKEVAYSLFVLALADNPQNATMNYYKAHSSMLSLDSKYMLAAAYALSGQKQKAKEVLPKAFEGERADQAFGGSFYSYTRDMALALYASQIVDPNDPQVPTLARMLSEQMRTSRYLNTQEKSFGLLALGKMAKRANESNATAALLVKGSTVATTKGDDISKDIKQYVGSPLNIKVTGTGSYYYFLETSGITTDGSYTEEDSYLRVRRTYYTRAGKPITDNTFKQNDLIVVQIILDAQYKNTVENVVVTDILPAGLEIENTRLNDIPGMTWMEQKYEPDYVDFRDDRVNIFTSADRSKKTFYYMVRAVSPGTFKVGPIQADAMYNGAFHSYHGAGTVQVTER